MLLRDLEDCCVHRCHTEDGLRCKKYCASANELFGNTGCLIFKNSPESREPAVVSGSRIHRPPIYIVCSPL
ncbi:hypothetical protein U0070_006665 [Myodes glareolus]|uniref:Uncharacterized protein n=1 Tax=Myodes glareolus TaxID=447135 RepID=A0AAW0HQA6_MYOGA